MPEKVKPDIMPRIFFSFPLAESERFKPIFRNACEEAKFLPVFADEQKEPEEKLFHALHRLIIECDAFIAVMPRIASSWVRFEFEYALATDKPVFLLTQRPYPTRYDAVLRVIRYRTREDLRKQLVSALSTLKLHFSRSDYVSKKEEENKIIDVLKVSMQSNVLVLGKDRDEEDRAYKLGSQKRRLYAKKAEGPARNQTSQPCRQDGPSWCPLPVCDSRGLEAIWAHI